VVSTKVGRVYDPAPRGQDARVAWKGGLNFAVRYDYSAEGFEASLAQSRLRLGQPVLMR
jgi:D-threo-aldose 1-dehydrogenase